MNMTTLDPVILSMISYERVDQSRVKATLQGESCHSNLGGPKICRVTGRRNVLCLYVYD